jgi:hypothetical protein
MCAAAVSPSGSTDSGSLHSEFGCVRGFGRGCPELIRQPWLEKHYDGEPVAQFVPSPAPTMLSMDGSASSTDDSPSILLPLVLKKPRHKVSRSDSDLQFAQLEHFLEEQSDDYGDGMGVHYDVVNDGVPAPAFVEGLPSPSKRTRVCDEVKAASSPMAAPIVPETDCLTPTSKLDAAQLVLGPHLLGKPLTSVLQFVEFLGTKSGQELVSKQLRTVWVHSPIASSYAVKALASVIKSTYVLTTVDEKGRKRFLGFRPFRDGSKPTVELTCPLAPSDAWVAFVTQVLGVKHLRSPSNSRTQGSCSGVREVTAKDLSTAGITAQVVSEILRALIKAKEDDVVLFT